MRKLFETAILEIVSEKTGIPCERIKVNAGEGDLPALEKALKERIVGQEEAKKDVLDHIGTRRVKKDLHKPIGCFLFVSPSGCGKTEMAKVIAESFFGDKRRMIRIDCSELREYHTVSTLIGAPPGYIGYHEGGVLTEAARRNSYSLVLFDEIEKADPAIYPLLLQIMDKGCLTNRSGLKADFRHTIVVLTSNLGNRKEEADIGFRKDKSSLDEKEEKRRFLQAVRQYFPPEFLGRLSKIIAFKRLGFEEIEKIFEMEINDLEEELGISLRVSDLARKILVKRAFSQEEGARRVKKTVRQFINAGIMRLKVEEGQKIHLDVDDEGDLVFEMITEDENE